MKYLLCLLLPIACFAQLRVAKEFDHHMVIQCNKPVRIFGKGNPHNSIEVLFANEKIISVVKLDSTWVAEFKKQKASAVPTKIIVLSGNERIELNNILIGDVWLCIGQSNMEWPAEKEIHFKEERLKMDQPLIRFYNPTFVGKNVFGKPYSDSLMKRLNPKDFYAGRWQTCDSNSVKTMSAVGYFFGKRIMKETSIPIGLLHLAIGGAPIETFVNPDVMKNNPAFAAKVKGNWLANDALPVWVRERGKENLKGNLKTLDDESPNHAYKPGFAFESGVYPLTKLPIKGILWYQGESNAQEKPRVLEYADLMKLMVDDYRKNWSDSALPFYFVQLSSIDSIKYASALWPSFRNEQRLALDKTKYSGMAVCSDIGARADVHPRDKKTVGDRLARWALKKTYNKKINPSGPLPLHAKYADGKITIHFRYAGKNLLTSDGQSVRGFSLDGKTDAAATINKQTITIETKEIPQYVYYAWKPYTDANLINSERLPATTFKIKIEK